MLDHSFRLKALFSITSQHPPLVNTRSKALLLVDHEANRRRFHRRKRHRQPFVQLIREGSLHRLPLLPIQDLDLIAIRQAAFADTRVIEPIQLRPRNDLRRLPRVLNPFRASLVRPEMAEGAGVGVGFLDILAIPNAFDLGVAAFE